MDQDTRDRLDRIDAKQKSINDKVNLVLFAVVLTALATHIDGGLRIENAVTDILNAIIVQYP